MPDESASQAGAAVYLVEDSSSGQPLIGPLLRLVHRHWANEIDAALRAAGFDDIRSPHASVVPFVPSQGIQVSRLAELARVRKQTMAEAVEQLESAGYVERRPDPSDRRARLVFLTERGRGVRPVAVKAGRRVEERWADLTSRRKVDSLRLSLQELLSALGREDEADRTAR